MVRTELQANSTLATKEATAITMVKLSSAALAAAVMLPTCAAFAPASSYLTKNGMKSLVATNMIPAELVTEVPAALLSAADVAATTTTAAAASSTNLLSFSDQGQNLAGIFFQASLLPYLGFLYFLSFRGNRTPNLGNFGWQYLLLFVLGTIPSGIITKSVYGLSLANVDWLHGGAEALLTMTNVLIVSVLYVYVVVVCNALLFYLVCVCMLYFTEILMQMMCTNTGAWIS